MAMKRNRPSWDGGPVHEGGQGAAESPIREGDRFMDGDVNGDELLPCGRSLALLWQAWDAEQADSDLHVAGCPHCAAALDRLQALQDLVAADETADRDFEAAAGRSDNEAFGSRVESVTARVMDVVRLELRPGRTLPLGEPEEDAWIVEAALAKLLRKAADALPGVRAGSCRIRPAARQDAAFDDSDSPPSWHRDATHSSETPNGSADESGALDTVPTRAVGGAPFFQAPMVITPDRGPVDVYLEVAATLSWTVPELARSVRERVTTAADETVGIRVRAIDVSVVDVLDDEFADPLGGVGPAGERSHRW
ncbi:hypothetical protein [Streptomyces fuscigenes]|uniref:hypothetical protein n=1 Tax=Streptomyces fuscigenes TaxID=1528880 RepID=UPI001F343530|nr:hypothetical protein [Streptomyces fuscigenes]MCF3960546.1 hypothetical protein [Streptomyces fuscigenes]